MLHMYLYQQATSHAHFLPHSCSQP